MSQFELSIFSGVCLILTSAQFGMTAYFGQNFFFIYFTCLCFFFYFTKQTIFVLKP